MKDNSKMGLSDSLIATVKSILEKKHTTPETPKEKALAKLAHPKDKITHKDVLVGRGVLKKENSGERMGVIVGTRKEKVELEPKLKEQVSESNAKSSMERIHADLIKHVPVGHHYWMDTHHSEGPLSDKDHEEHKQTARSDEVKIKVSHHRDEDGYHHVLIHSPHKEDVKAAADHLYDDKSVMKKRKDDDAHYAKYVKEQVIERKLTGAETNKKEKLVLSLKKKMGGFKKRYGERAKEVMYATATKMAKNEEVKQVDEKITSHDYEQAHLKRVNTPATGVRGEKTKKLSASRRLKNREHWGTYSIGAGPKGKLPEEVKQVAEISTGMANRYLSKTKDDDTRKAGRTLALKKKWGGKVGGTESPKVPTKD